MTTTTTHDFTAADYPWREAGRYMAQNFPAAKLVGMGRWRIARGVHGQYSVGVLTIGKGV